MTGRQEDMSRWRAQILGAAAASLLAGWTCVPRKPAAVKTRISTSLALPLGKALPISFCGSRSLCAEAPGGP